MKTPYKNIYDVLRLNRFVTITVTVAALLATIFSGSMVYSVYQKAMDSAFAIQTDGSVIPLKLISQRENRKVEALAHLELFHHYFYGLDAATYEANLEKALWLGGSSVDNVYRQKKADGVYNRLLQYALIQRILSVDSQVDLNTSPYAFRTVTIFEINRGSVTDRYELTTTGKLQEVARDFPKNTHGLLITDFYENTLKRMNNEN